LRDHRTGTFIIRFSDSLPGSFAVAYKADDTGPDRVRHYLIKPEEISNTKSLPDFLRDKGRSQDCCISAFPTQLCIFWLQKAACGLFKDLDQSKQNSDILDLLPHAEATSDLLASLATYKPVRHRSAFAWNFFPKDLLTVLHPMDFGDGGKVYDEMFDTFVRYVKKEFPSMLHYMTLSHDISQVLERIDLEEIQSRVTDTGLGHGAEDSGEPKSSSTPSQHNAAEGPGPTSTTPLVLDTVGTVQPSSKANFDNIIKFRTEPSLQEPSHLEDWQSKKLSRRAKLKAWFKRRVASCV